MSLLSLSKKILGGTKKEAAKEKAASKKKTAVATQTPAPATKGLKFSVLAGALQVHAVLSEKSMAAQAKNVLVVRVATMASKHDIARAVAEMFGVKVMSVRTANLHPKNRRRGVTSGRTKQWKKAYVTVDDISKVNQL